MNLFYNENCYLVCFTSRTGNHVYSYYSDREVAVRVANELNESSDIRYLSKFFYVDTIPSFVIHDLLGGNLKSC